MPYRPSPRAKTRIYDSNYDRGHSLYKSALDGIDAKYSMGRTLRETSLPKPKIDFGFDSGDGTLSEARQRAHRAITEETVFDSKGFKVPKVGVPLSSSEVERNFDAEIQSSLERLRANKVKALEADMDLDLPKVSSFARKARAEISEAIHGTSNISESSNFVKKRALKVASSAVDSALDTHHLSKWTKLSATEDAESLAKQRALESQARIRELEDDISTRQERQLARERRAANLRKMINEEFNINNVDEELKAITF